VIELLTRTSRGGILSASVIARAGAEPHTAWVPESGDEPAFLVFSITKTIVATLVLGLCEEGRIRLDDPLARWFPRIPRAESITIRRLLNHTAGIPDYGSLAAYHASVRSAPSAPWAFDRFAAETFGKGLAFAPGEGWQYSNPGYMLVKCIVEDVAGASLRDVVRARIVDPLGLRRTFVPERVDDLASLAPALSRALTPDAAPRDVRECYHPGWVPHGVVASTASDIVRFFDGLFRGRLLSAASLRQMMEFVPVPGIEQDRYRRRPSYGLGVMGDPESPWGLVAGHNGGGPGYSVSAFHAAGLHGASVCVMAATEDVRAEDIVFHILDDLAREGNRAARDREENGGDAEHLRTIDMLTPEQLTRVGDTYLPAHLGIVVTEVDSGRLRAHIVVEPHHMAPNGYLHAATVVALADTAAGYGCRTAMPERAIGFTTIELPANFLGTAREGVIDCVATAVHLGTSTHVWDAVVTHRETGRMIAVFRCTQMILYPRATPGVEEATK
jgi:D-alanyl-D-alanine carboxypeptidase